MVPERYLMFLRCGIIAFKMRGDIESLSQDLGNLNEITEIEKTQCLKHSKNSLSSHLKENNLFPKLNLTFHL